MDSDHSTSVTLLERLRGRDEQAWGRLVHLYAPLVHHWCQRAGVPAQDVADLQQEVFAAVAAGLDGFRRDRPEDTFRGWLRGITRHKLADYRRRRGSQPDAAGGTTVQRLLQQVPEPELLDEPADQINGLFLRAVELVRGEFEAKTWTAFWRRRRRSRAGRNCRRLEHDRHGRPQGQVTRAAPSAPGNRRLD